MIDAVAEFEKLREIYPSAQIEREGGHSVVLLPKARFLSAGCELRMDLLLHPFSHCGYPTRLFFERQVAERGQNWGQHCVAGRQWWACSWNNVPADMSWPAMLSAHLRAVA